MQFSFDMFCPKALFPKLSWHNHNTLYSYCFVNMLPFIASLQQTLQVMEWIVCGVQPRFIAQPWVCLIVFADYFFTFLWRGGKISDTFELNSWFYKPSWLKFCRVCLHIGVVNRWVWRKDRIFFPLLPLCLCLSSCREVALTWASDRKSRQGCEWMGFINV